MKNTDFFFFFLISKSFFTVETEKTKILNKKQRAGFAEKRLTGGGGARLVLCPVF